MNYPHNAGDGWEVIKITATVINSAEQFKNLLIANGIENYEYAAGIVIRDFSAAISTDNTITDFVYRGDFNISTWTRYKTTNPVGYQAMTSWTNTYSGYIPDMAEIIILAKK